jgi:hypothetical protein
MSHLVSEMKIVKGENLPAIVLQKQLQSIVFARLTRLFELVQKKLTKRE